MDQYLLIYESVSDDRDDAMFAAAILSLRSARRVLAKTWTFQAGDTDARRLALQLKEHAGDRVRFVICRTEGCGVHQLDGDALSG